MAKALNFNTVKKNYWTVTLPDEKQTTLMIGTPTKALIGELMTLQETIEDMRDDINDETMGELYRICAKILSRNKTNTKITVDDIEDVFDFEDIVILFDAYTSFVSEVCRSKN